MSAARRSAAVILLALCGAPARARAQDQVAFAQQRFLRGQDLYERRQYAAALVEFEASRQLYASPNARLYVARSLRGLGRLVEAVEHFEQTLREATERARTDPRYESTREAAATELREVAPQLGRVVVAAPAAPPGVRVRVGPREIPPSALGLALWVTPGSLDVVLEAEGRAPVRRTVSVAAGQTLEVTMPQLGAGAVATPPTPRVEPTPLPARMVPRPAPHAAPVPVGTPPARSSASPYWALAGTGAALGGAALGAALVFEVLAADRYRTLDARCDPRPCAPGQESVIDAGVTYQTLTNTSLVVAAAGLALGAVFLVAGVATRRPGAPRARRVAAGAAGIEVVF